MPANWMIEVPQDYFARSAAKEYSDDAGMAVVREFTQNSADAGATRVEFDFLSAGADGSARLTVSDNGRGCDAATVRERILTPLGTQKEAGAIGGFGKAKELLFFANPAWTIRTRDVAVTGSYLTVLSFESGLAPIAGFSATVQLPPILHVAAANTAEQFLRRSERPGVQWVLNGTPVACAIVRARRATKDFGFARAYVTRGVDDSRIYLRTGGLLTAVRWGHHGATVGRVVIELTGPSSELLTPARDWFRAALHRQQVEHWLQQLVTNATQALAKDFGDEVCFHDLAPFEPAPVAVAASGSDTSATLGFPARVQFLSSAPATAQMFAARALDAASTDADVVVAASTEVAASAPPAAPAQARSQRRQATRFDMSLLPAIPGLTRVVVHTGGKKQAAIATRWLRKHHAGATKALASWATAVQVIAAQTAHPIDAIGFTFAPHAEAEFVRVGSRFALLLNPLTIDLMASDAADELLDRALHETVHLAHGAAHDENFVLTECALRRKTRGVRVRGAIARALRTAEVQTIEAV